MARRILSALAARAAARPVAVLSAAAALALAGALLASTLTPSAATETFVGRSSAAYRATETFYRQFGEEPIEVLVQGELQRLLLGPDLERLLGLEGCLAGRVPAKALVREGGASGACAGLARAHAVKVVIGPATFINEAATQIDAELASVQGQARAQAKRAEASVYERARAVGASASVAKALAAEARSATLGAFAAEVAALAVRYGITTPPAFNNREFIQALVFDRAAPAGTPKQRFAYLFPSKNAALISVRLRAGLSEGQRRAAIALVRRAVAMPQWRLEAGARYLVTGEPVLVSDLTGTMAHAIELLLIAVVVVMAGALSLLFGARPRLLPLAIALLACALAFGGLALAGGSLTLGALAVLPALVGLAVDYAVQLQSRMAEQTAHGADASLAASRAAAQGAPAIAGAALASCCAMLALLFSPVPLVRGFGVLLVVGVALAFLCALTVGTAAVVASARARSGKRSRSWGALGAAWRGARELVGEGPLPSAFARAAIDCAVRRPAVVLSAGLVLAAAGWALSTQAPVDTDITKLVPQSLPSLRSLTALERETGVGGQVDLLVSSRDLERAASIEWMSSYERAVLARFGPSSSGGTAVPACARAALCPAFSLPDLFADAEGEATAAGSASSSARGGRRAGAGTKRAAGAPPKLTQGEVAGLLAAIPPYFSQNVISADRRYATLAFGLRLMPLDRQQRVIEAMRRMLHPPPGVRAQLVGLAVLAAQADAAVASPWRRVWTLLVSVAFAGLVLLVLNRRAPRRALAAILPVAMASGWSGLVLFVTQVPLNPMSVTLSILVVAIATEFSVLLCERYREERAAGAEPPSALRLTYARTGAAVATSGVTALAGFAVLALSQIRMLQEFGIATIVDLGVSLVGVLFALPAVLVLIGEPSVGGGRLGEVGHVLGERITGVAGRLRARGRRVTV